jgi:hypothetical protein
VIFVEGEYAVGTVNKSDFQEAMRSGLGRAIIYARDNDVRPFRDVILDACLHCYSADCQSEGTRAPFMFDLVNLTPEREFYHGEVLKSLHACGDDWDAVQRFRFASYLAMDGDDRARRAVYENFNPGPWMVGETGADFVRMDGTDGLLFAAEKVGELLLTKPKDVNTGFLLGRAIEDLGEEQTLSALREAGKTNPRIEAYRLKAEADRAPKPSRKGEQIKRLTYKDLKSQLGELRAYWAGLWGEHAGSEDLELAARDLLAAETSDERLAYLRIFSRTPFPVEHHSLLKLVGSLVESDESRIALAAATALSNITDPVVRDLAFRLVETRRPGRERAISMLSRNWEPDDHEIAIRWFAQEEDREARHRLSMDLRNLWDVHPDPTSEVRMWITIYEKGTVFVLPRDFSFPPNRVARVARLGTRRMRLRCGRTYPGVSA